MYRFGGFVVCLVTLVFAGLFLWGIAVRNHWALAIPVIVGFLGALAVVFWIGWTMAFTEGEAPGEPAAQEKK